jgi:hypothetical protein
MHSDRYAHDCTDIAAVTRWRRPWIHVPRQNSVALCNFCGQKIWFRHRFPGTCETVGQVFKFEWRLCWKINVVCVSLSPFNSFQSRFVTYLLNYPCKRISSARSLESYKNETCGIKTLYSARLVGLDSNQLCWYIHTAATAVSCKPQSHCSVFVSLTGLDWIKLCWCVCTKREWNNGYVIVSVAWYIYRSWKSEEDCSLWLNIFDSAVLMPHATCTIHDPAIHLPSLSPVTYDGRYNLWSYTLCSLFQFPVTFSNKILKTVQHCTETQSTVFPQCHWPSVTPTSYKNTT